MSDELPSLEAMNAAFRELVPHNRWLGTELIAVTFEPATATMRLPYEARFVGNPETGVVHGGVISTLIDACAGAAVYMRLKAPVPIATLDLRVDFLKPATPGKPILCRADCFKATKNVAFIRAIAFHDDHDDPIASAAATFMISTKGKAVTV